MAKAKSAKQPNRKATVQVYGNRRTRRYHGGTRNDACRFAEIARENRERFNSPGDAEEFGYTACRVKGCVVK